MTFETFLITSSKRNDVAISNQQLKSMKNKIISLYLGQCIQRDKNN